MARVPFDVRLVDVKAHPYAVGSATLTCPCGHRETVTRLVAESARLAHAAACTACLVPDPDVPAVVALSEALARTGVKGSLASTSRDRACEILRLLRAQGLDITKKGTS